MNDRLADSTATNCLLEQAAAGDEDAFARLLERHHAVLRRAIGLRLDGKLARRCDVSDVVQETHLTAFRRLQEFLKRRPMPFRVWLERTALERLRDLRRHHVETAKRSVRREQAAGDLSSLALARSLAASGVTPSGIVAAAESAQRLEQAMGELNENDREVLLMRYVERRSNREVALVLDISEKAASKRHGAALLRLRAIMRRLFPGEE